MKKGYKCRYDMLPILIVQKLHSVGYHGPDSDTVEALHMEKIIGYRPYNFPH